MPNPLDAMRIKCTTNRAGSVILELPAGSSKVTLPPDFALALAAGLMDATAKASLEIKNPPEFSDPSIGYLPTGVSVGYLTTSKTTSLLVHAGSSTLAIQIREPQQVGQLLLTSGTPATRAQ